MNFSVSFSIGLAHDHHRPGDVTVDAPEIFCRLTSLEIGTTPLSKFVYNVEIDSRNDRLIEAFEMLKKHVGRKPVADLKYAVDHSDKFYPVLVRPEADKQELDSMRWLYLGVPEMFLAEFKAVEPDDSYVIRKVLGKRKLAFGCTRTVGAMKLFSVALKDELLKGGLHPLDFTVVKLEDGKPSGLWQMRSPVFLPPIAMPLVDAWGLPLTGDLSRGCGLNDGNYWPKILRYTTASVASLPDFDVAMSAERFGPGSHNMHRYCIVSQRFRQVAEKLAPGQFKYGLVAIGEGEELRTRYTIPELAPPRGAE